MAVLYVILGVALGAWACYEQVKAQKRQEEARRRKNFAKHVAHDIRQQDERDDRHE